MEAGKFSKKYNQLNDKQKEKYSRKEWKQARERAQQRAAKTGEGNPDAVRKNDEPNRRMSTPSAQDLIKSSRERNNSTGKPSMTGREAAAWSQARNNPQPAATPNEQALNNEHTPKANDVGSQAKPAAPGSITWETRDQLPSYVAGNIDHHATEKERKYNGSTVPGLGRVQQMERWLNDDYRNQRSQEDGVEYTYTGHKKKDDTEYRQMLLEQRGQAELDAYDERFSDENRFKRAAAAAADARQRYEFLAGGHTTANDRSKRSEQRYSGGHSWGDQLQLVNSNVKESSYQVYSPKTGQMETGRTFENPDMAREVSVRREQAWKDYIDYGKVPDFSDLISKYNMTKGEYFDAGTPQASGSKQMGYVRNGQTYYEPDGLTPNQKFNKMQEARAANPGVDINPDNWFAYV